MCFVIPSHLPDFLTSKAFVDCILSSGSNQYECHRLILAKSSKYFTDLFRSLHMTSRVTQVEMDFNPKEALGLLLKLLYGFKIIVDENNIVALISTAQKYNFASIYNLLLPKLEKMINTKTILGFIQELSDYNMTEILAHFIIMISSYFSSLVFSHEQFYQILRPCEFVKIINSFKFTDTVKAQYADEYSKFHEFKEGETRYFDEYIDYNSQDSFLIALNFECKWMPLSESRKLFRKALSARRSAVQQLEQYVPSDCLISRWYPFVCFTQIAQNPAQGFNIKIEAISYISTLGGFCKHFNPIKYGLISVDSSPPFFSKSYFAAENAIEDDDKYFVGTSISYSFPWIGVDLGPSAKFTFSNISCDTAVPRAGGLFHDPPGEIASSVGPSFDQTRSYYRGAMPPSRCAVVKMIKHGARGTCKLRIRQIQLYGTFSP